MPANMLPMPSTRRVSPASAHRALYHSLAARSAAENEVLVMPPLASRPMLLSARRSARSRLISTVRVTTDSIPGGDSGVRLGVSRYGHDPDEPPRLGCARAKRGMLVSRKPGALPLPGLPRLPVQQHDQQPTPDEEEF